LVSGYRLFGIEEKSGLEQKGIVLVSKKNLAWLLLVTTFSKQVCPNNKKRNKWPWNIMHQQGLSDPMSLGGAKEYFKKAESNL